MSPETSTDRNGKYHVYGTNRSTGRHLDEPLTPLAVGDAALKQAREQTEAEVRALQGRAARPEPSMAAAQPPQGWGSGRGWPHRESLDHLRQGKARPSPDSLVRDPRAPHIFALTSHLFRCILPRSKYKLSGRKCMFVVSFLSLPAPTRPDHRSG
jgi:hypothetical protein